MKTPQRTQASRSGGLGRREGLERDPWGFGSRGETCRGERGGGSVRPRPTRAEAGDSGEELGDARGRGAAGERRGGLRPFLRGGPRYPPCTHLLPLPPHPDLRTQETEGRTVSNLHEGAGWVMGGRGRHQEWGDRGRGVRGGAGDASSLSTPEFTKQHGETTAGPEPCRRGHTARVRSKGKEVLLLGSPKTHVSSV